MIGGMDDEFDECHRRTICTSLYSVYTTHSYFPAVVRAFEAIRGIILFVYEKKLTVDSVSSGIGRINSKLLKAPPSVHFVFSDFAEGLYVFTSSLSFAGTSFLRN